VRAIVRVTVVNPVMVDGPLCALLLPLSLLKSVKDWIATGSFLLFYLRGGTSAQKSVSPSGHPIITVD